MRTRGPTASRLSSGSDVTLSRPAGTAIVLSLVAAAFAVGRFTATERSAADPAAAVRDALATRGSQARMARLVPALQALTADDVDEYLDARDSSKPLITAENARGTGTPCPHCGTVVEAVEMIFGGAGYVPSCPDCEAAL